MDLLSSTLGAVGQIGEGIDKFTGGRALRGAVAGKPRELASILPFSDTLGLTRPEDSTSGRDLTDMYGLTQKGDNSFGSHAAGFLADNVLSPANMLGAYGAFKAAPTIAKGLTQGAKALTGLDLLDHIGAGAKKLGGLLGGEAGSLRAPHVPPNPVDVGNMKETSLAANATRPRRYSTDPARKGWYQGDRTARFGRRFGGGPGNTAVPGGIPEFSLGDAIKRFGADESGSLHLPYDGLTKPPSGIIRSDPEWVNNRTAFHGTGVANLEGAHLDPRKTSEQNLFGHGIYTTDNQPISATYAKRGAGIRGTPQIYQSRSNFGKILELNKKISPDIAEMTGDLKSDLYKRLTAGIDPGDAEEFLDEMPRGWNEPSGHNDEAIQSALAFQNWAEMNGDRATQKFVRSLPLTQGLKGRGYDALTHTGGEELGGVRHQVTIGLDPNDFLGTGRKTPYSIWEAMKHFGSDESGAVKIPRAPFTPEQVQKLTGKLPEHLDFDEATRAYQPWVDSLSPEERSAIKLFTSGPQARISHALRNASETSGGHAVDPFADGMLRVERGTHPIRTHEDVHSEVTPYLDSALSRGMAPKDLMTYRLAGRLGDLNPENAEKMIGKSVSDPSYLSTTLNPGGRFYGNNADPRNLLLDILAPRGSHGGYADAISSWSAEKELLLPRDAQFGVRGVQRVPSQKIDYDWHRLDPAGKPIPLPGHHGSGLFTDDAADKFYGQVAKQGQFGDAVVPDELMAPDWREYASRNLKGEGQQANALLEMQPSPMAPHQAQMRRLTPQEMAAELERRFQSTDPSRFSHEDLASLSRSPEEMIKRLIKDEVQRPVRAGIHPDWRTLELLDKYGIPATDLMRSRPTAGGKLLDAIKGFVGSESGYLRHAIPGVPEDLANAMDGLGPQYPGGVDKLRSIVEGAADKLRGSTAYDSLGDLQDRFNLLMQGPHAERVASEIPPGSSFLGAGMEGIAMRTPEGGVVRIGDHPDQANRPDIPEMLQAFREQRVGPYKIEHMPQVAPVYQEFDQALKDTGKGQYSDELARAIEANNQMNDLHDDAAYNVRQHINHNQKMVPWDVSAWNTGMTPEGHAIVFDGGAVRPSVRLPGEAADHRFAPKPTHDAPEGDLLRRVMEAGGPEKVRESLRQGLHMGTVGQGIMTPEMPRLASLRDEVQDYLSLNGVNPGVRAGWRGSSLGATPPYVSATGGPAAPSMGKLFGTLGATAGGAGLLAYLLGNQGQ